MQVGTKFKGQINNEVFEIIEEINRSNKIYFKVKQLKSGNIYEHEKQFIEHLLVEKI